MRELENKRPGGLAGNLWPVPGGNLGRGDCTLGKMKPAGDWQCRWLSGSGVIPYENCSVWAGTTGSKARSSRRLVAIQAGALLAAAARAYTKPGTAGHCSCGRRTVQIQAGSATKRNSTTAAQRPRHRKCSTRLRRQHEACSPGAARGRRWLNCSLAKRRSALKRRSCFTSACLIAVGDISALTTQVCLTANTSSS